MLRLSLTQKLPTCCCRGDSKPASLCLACSSLACCCELTELVHNQTSKKVARDSLMLSKGKKKEERICAFVFILFFLLLLSLFSLVTGLLPEVQLRQLHLGIEQQFWLGMNSLTSAFFFFFFLWP